MRVQPNIPQVTKADFDKQEKKKHFKVKVVCLQGTEILQSWQHRLGKK